ncbi:ABC transporter ATP-binding protein/permease [Paractinoplanes rishiriensis]|uniref:ABC transporter domain-containing protein n=1 Tax=Paractinoplanes rishiriensis TaxID=1050105 RepID=A0A919K6P1_9ACTN|nr:ABC transporter ATP-binding protein/permease [Actinoplanes rishiriensis]GIE99910.1 hypothetical protein Ari01nite_73750 [Actinoplanes rishiriensis]
MSAPLVRADRVSRSFGDIRALDDVSLAIGVGELVGLLGPNGAGKSTLIDLFAGLRRPTAGTVTIDGRDPRLPPTRRMFGVTPQRTALPETWRVAELIDFVATHYPRPVDRRTLLARFDLGPLQDRQIGGLSGGQQRRVAVALAFAGRPRVVFLDEPTTGLDVEARHALWDGVRAFHAEGRVPSHHVREKLMSPALVYTRRELIETVRAPGSFLTITLMPLAVLISFILPNVGDDPAAITGATATMVVFATLLACVGQFSTTIAALRESAWGTYLRTLPVGLRPLAVGNLLTGLVFVAGAVLPIVLVGALFTEASVPAVRLLAGLLALLVATVVFTLLGLALGYTLSLRAAVLVNSILALALAVGGGMFSDPANMPGPIEAVAPYLPTRGTTDLVLAALTGRPADPLALAMLGVWSVVLAALTGWGFRRDEGRRFR